PTPARSEAIDRANLDLALGHLDDAIATLRFVAVSQAEEAVRTRAASMAEELEQNRTRNRHVELFNDAVDLAEDHDVHGALAILDRLIPELTDEDICASAGALQAELRRVVRGR
ncbi:MAG TPA: hypothetical protein VJ276_23475, partial [Thermoanaerobaculia bacterium]|nr:hypothetical protein [Thermoanaerobaculia bacterium]